MAGLRSRTLPILCATLLCLSIAVRADEPAACDIHGDFKADDWRARCDAAIGTESQPKARAQLLFHRAWAAIEQYRYDDALKDLDAALSADPDNPAYLGERAYLYGELAELPAAIADLDRLIALQPQDPAGYRERAYARHFSGDLAGAYADRSKALELDPDSIQSRLARSRAALWLGRFDEAQTDAGLAADHARAVGDPDAIADASEQRSVIDRWRNTSKGANPGKLCTIGKGIDESSPPTLIGDCSYAFLHAKDGEARAEALTTRSTAWLVIAKVQTLSIEDLRVALALDPKNVNRRINLGYSFLLSNHSWAANREFERALAIERSPLALAGRGAARANLGDSKGAFEDARASMELKPNVAAAELLAGLDYDKGDKEQARSLYLTAYSLGARDDRVLARLKELGVQDPAKGARK